MKCSRCLTLTLLTGLILSQCVAFSTGSAPQQSPSSSPSVPKTKQVVFAVFSHECFEILKTPDSTLRVPVIEKDKLDWDKMRVAGMTMIKLNNNPVPPGCHQSFDIERQP